MRGNGPPSIERLSEWQTHAYPTLRRQRESGTPTHNALPDDDELDVVRMITAIRSLGMRVLPEVTAHDD